MTDITVNDASGTVRRLTPMAQMHWDAMIVKFSEHAGEVMSADQGYEVPASALMRYLDFCVRVPDVAGTGFDIATPLDKPGEFVEKWKSFLNAEDDLDFIVACEKAMKSLDAAIDPVLAPNPPTGMTAPEKKDDATGKTKS